MASSAKSRSICKIGIWNLGTVQYMLAAKTKYDSNLWDDRVVPVVYRKLGLER